MRDRICWRPCPGLLVLASVRVGWAVTDCTPVGDRRGPRAQGALDTPAYDRGIVAAVRELLGDDAVAEVVHGTTVATNAVLEKLGARTAIVTTWLSGRPRAAADADATPLRLLLAQAGISRTRGGCASRSTSGCRPPERRCAPSRTRRRGGSPGSFGRPMKSIAVCLLHAHLYPEHERLLGEICRAELPDAGLALLRDPARQQEYSAPRRRP